MSSTGYTCIRTIFCWINVFFWITGCGLLGIGVWLRIAYEGYTSLLPQYSILGADSLAIAVGAVIIVLSFFACCGSWFKNRCMLITYFSLVVFTFIAEFVFGSLAFIFRSKLNHELKLELQNGLAHHYNITTSGPNSLVDIWDHIQLQFKCCGVLNYEDWYMIDSWPAEKWVPDSCCLPADLSFNCGKTVGSDHFYPKGCYDQIHMWFIQRLHIVGVLGLILAFMQLFGLISSMILFCRVKQKINTRTYRSYS